MEPRIALVMRRKMEKNVAHKKKRSGRQRRKLRSESVEWKKHHNETI